MSLGNEYTGPASSLVGSVDGSFVPQVRRFSDYVSFCEELRNEMVRRTRMCQDLVRYSRERE